MRVLGDDEHHQEGDDRVHGRRAGVIVPEWAVDAVEGRHFI